MAEDAAIPWIACIFRARSAFGWLILGIARFWETLGLLRKRLLYEFVCNRMRWNDFVVGHLLEENGILLSL